MAGGMGPGADRDRVVASNLINDESKVTHRKVTCQSNF